MPWDPIFSIFVDKDHNHITMGSFKTISNNKMCKRLSIVHIIDKKTADYEKAKESLTGIK